jgi:hypothetical protein
LFSAAHGLLNRLLHGVQSRALRVAATAEPENVDMQRRLRIAERILAKSHYYDVARECGPDRPGRRGVLGQAFNIDFLIDEGVIDPLHDGLPPLYRPSPVQISETARTRLRMR